MIPDHELRILVQDCEDILCMYSALREPCAVEENKDQLTCRMYYINMELARLLGQLRRTEDVRSTDVLLE
jgi:hypothetical protein